MLHSPRLLTITESNPEIIANYRVSVRAGDGTTELAAGLYPPAGTTTVVPIGSNGLQDPIPDGTTIRIFVLEAPTEGHGDNTPYQEVPGGPFVSEILPDGAESLEVTV